MDQTVTVPPQKQTAEHMTPQRRQRRMETYRVAWIVLTLSFITFITVCASLSFGVYYFAFQSGVSMNAQVTVAQGTVGLVSRDLSERFDDREESVFLEDRVSTDSQSQAQVVFRDAVSPQTLAASVTLLNDSEMEVLRMVQPRYEWGRIDYQVVLQVNQGIFDIYIPATLPRATSLTFNLPYDVLVDVSESGQYTLIVTEEQIEMHTRSGRAAILPVERSQARSIATGQIGVYDVLRGQASVSNEQQELIPNNIFTTQSADFEPVEDGSAVTFDLWNCTDRTQTTTPGVLEWVRFQGRLALHIVRTGTQTHGETGCIQPLGDSAQSGSPVAGYSDLTLRSTFYIADHSLDGCGVAASECPLMLLIDYIDTDGDRNKWFQGFYAKFDPLSEYPTRCNSAGCEEHKAINGGAWYVYESGNLLNSLPADRQPESILNVQFYASGHGYDIYISDLSLLATPG
ncbi:MAG: hypothetical protein AAF653_03685 [Chloroflexota bacterium]